MLPRQLYYKMQLLELDELEAQVGKQIPAIVNYGQHAFDIRRNAGTTRPARSRIPNTIRRRPTVVEMAQVPSGDAWTRHGAWGEKVRLVRDWAECDKR